MSYILNTMATFRSAVNAHNASTNTQLAFFHGLCNMHESTTHSNTIVMGLQHSKTYAAYVLITVNYNVLFELYEPFRQLSISMRSAFALTLRRLPFITSLNCDLATLKSLFSLMQHIPTEMIKSGTAQSSSLQFFPLYAATQIEGPVNCPTQVFCSDLSIFFQQCAFSAFKTWIIFFTRHYNHHKVFHRGDFWTYHSVLNPHFYIPSISS